MKTWLNWNDPVFIFGGAEDFLWNEAYRVVNEVAGGLGLWDIPRKRPIDEIKKKLPPELVEKFIDVVVNVNGLTKIYRKNTEKQYKITAEHIHNTFAAFNIPRPTVKIIANDTQTATVVKPRNKIIIKAEIINNELP